MGDGINVNKFTVEYRTESPFLAGTKHFFKFGNGEETEVNGDTADALNSLFQHIMKYSTDESPDITPEEQWNLTEDIYSDLKTQQRSYSEGYYDTINKIFTDNYDRFKEHYSDKNSPGGENITVDELYLMSKKFINIFSDKK